MKIPKFLRQFGHTFHEAGYQCYLVGGAVRNMIAGLPATDFDFATDAEPEAVRRLFSKVIPTGILHGTVTVLYRGHHLEVTTFRVEGTYSDSRRPDSVEFIPSIYEDLKRRDFTINAIAYDLSSGELIDPHLGKEDIQKKIIQAIGSPADRFSEDPLRMLRACRFSAQLEFSVEDATLQGIVRCCSLIINVSSERVRDELIKIVTSPDPRRGFLLMDKTGLLKMVIPELSACKNVPQKGMHKFDVFHHSLMSMEFAENKLHIRLAALLHDIGKPDTLSYNEHGQPMFHNHETVSEEKSRSILRRMKFPKAVEKTVCALVRNHMFSYDNLQTDSAVRRFISRVGRDALFDLFLLRRADSCGIIGKRYACPKLSELENKINSLLRAETALTVGGLRVDGHILSEEAGIPKGPAMGKVLSFLLEAVIDDPEMNTKDRLVELARNYYGEYLSGA